MKPFIENALLEAAKAFVPATGYLHYNEQIPLYDNVLYVCCLFESKQTEQMKEALRLLDKLCAFERDGQFPRHIHEYPTPASPNHQIELYASLRLLHNRFATIMDATLSQKLTMLLDRMRSALQAKELYRTKQELFSAIEGKPTRVTPSTAREWEDALLAFLFGAQLPPLPWNSELMMFTGPSHVGWYGHDPQPTLVDFWMSAACTLPLKRLAHPTRTHLKAALLPSAFSEIQTTEDMLFSGSMLYCGDPQHIYSLSVNTSGDVTISENEVAIQLEAVEHPVEQDYDELHLYFPASEETDYFINGGKQTIFTFDDTLTLTYPNGQLELSFSQEGEGEFMGHIARGDRPCQQKSKDDRGFTHYDMCILIRSLRREKKCAINIAYAHQVATLA